MWPKSKGDISLRSAVVSYWVRKLRKEFHVLPHISHSPSHSGRWTATCFSGETCTGTSAPTVKLGRGHGFTESMATTAQGQSQFHRPQACWECMYLNTHVPKVIYWLPGPRRHRQFFFWVFWFWGLIAPPPKPKPWNHTSNLYLSACHRRQRINNLKDKIRCLSHRKHRNKFQMDRKLVRGM